MSKSAENERNANMRDMTIEIDGLASVRRQNRLDELDSPADRGISGDGLEDESKGVDGRPAKARHFRETVSERTSRTMALDVEDDDIDMLREVEKRKCQPAVQDCHD